jgi:hypothetical protein
MTTPTDPRLLRATWANCAAREGGCICRARECTTTCATYLQSTRASLLSLLNEEPTEGMVEAMKEAEAIPAFILTPHELKDLACAVIAHLRKEIGGE